MIDFLNNSGSIPNAAPIFILPAILIGIAIAFVLLALFMWLWNSTIPGIFGVRAITFWEAFKLLVLASILFGGMRLPFGYSSSTTTAEGRTVSWSIGQTK